MDETKKRVGTWVQTERKAHEDWAKLIGKSHRAAQLLHLLVAHMDKRGVLVVSQKTLAEMMGVSVDTVKRALVPLKAGNWVDVVRVGSARGGVNMYAVNRRVAWADKRENQRFAVFDAKVILSKSDQLAEDMANKEPLKTLPSFGELQSPHGGGLPPPSQPFLDGSEPDLPAIGDGHLQTDIED